jgi:hypothetical protein
VTIRRRGSAWCVVGALLLAACGGGGSSAACGAVTRIIEPGNIHVLPGAEVKFENSPPTSGPHLVPAPPPGVARSPIPEPQQVAALESGYVLVQYEASLDPDDVAVLEALAERPDVVVAPGQRAFDDAASVALTAWSKRQLCTEVDVDQVQAFIDAHAGVFFTSHG